VRPASLLALVLALASCERVPRATAEQCDDACRHLVELNFRKSGLTQAQCNFLCAEQGYDAKDTACIREAQQIDDAEMCVMRAKARYDHKGWW
jgi:hypothetical protein